MQGDKYPSFLDVMEIDDHLQKSGVLSALLSPRLKTRNEGSTAAGESMLMQFAGSIEEHLVHSFGSLYKSTDNFCEINRKNSSREEILLRENIHEFKHTLRVIKGDRTTDGTNTIPLKGEKPSATASIEVIEEKMKPWIELTNVHVEPDIKPIQLKPDKQVDRKQLTTVKARQPVRLSEIKKRLSDFSMDKLITQATVNINSTKARDVEYVCFTFQFLIITERLKVAVRNATNLFKNTDSYNESNSFAEVCLVPGKVQLQTSEIVRRSKNPDFKSIFYFRGFTLEEAHLMNLRIRLLGKKNILSRPKIIGEVVVSLENFDLVSENLLEEQLHTRIVSRASGSIRQVLI